MPCCFAQRASIYSSELQLQTSSPSSDQLKTTITSGQYYLMVHAPDWAPDILVKAAAALKDAITGQFQEAWTIAFGTYTVETNTAAGAKGTVIGSQTVGSAADLSKDHKTLVYPFTLTAKTTGQVLPQLETIAGIVAAIAGVLIVFGILWIVIEIDKAVGAAGPWFWIIVALGAVFLLSKPEIRKSISAAIPKAPAPRPVAKAKKK